MTTGTLSEQTLNSLNRRGIMTRMITDRFTLPPEIELSINCLAWRNTFVKLEAFELTEYDKVILMDSDMIVTQNIDHLFEQPHLSAVRASGTVTGYEDWTMPNSGFIVIAPQLHLGEKIFLSWPELAAKKRDFGDQDLIHHYFKEHWLQPDKWLLSTRYNCMVFLIDRICKELDFRLTFSSHSERSISVLHFVIKNRPWQMSRPEQGWFFIRRILKGKLNEVKATWFYVQLLKEVRQRSEGQR